MANEFGIDTAFNVVIPTSTANKIDFALPRIGTFGYGSTGTSAYYNKNLSVDGGFLSTVNNMHSAGKPVGCYIFSYAFDTISAEAEANRVCDYLDNNGVDLDLPVFFDWERTGPGTYGSYEMVTAAGITVTANLVQNMTSAFCFRVAQRGRRCGWYQSKGDLDSWFGVDIVNRLKNVGYILWMAQWGSSYQTYSPDVWQYAGDTYYDGISCDLNKVISDRFFDGDIPPHPGKLPSWIYYKLAENQKSKGVVYKIW